MARLRVVFVIIGLTLGFHASHAFSGVGDDCIQGCDDDGPDGTCPPDCTDCVCCVHQAPIVSQTFTLAPPAIGAERPPFANSNEQPSSPDPRELQHVPKSLLD